MIRIRKSVCFALLIFSGAIARSFADESVEKVAAAEELFVRRISPLLQEKCLACHGSKATEIEGGLDLRSQAGAQTGGDSEQAGIVNGQPMESPLYLAATREHADWSAMPPKEAEKLTAQQLGWLREWISAGAAWPSVERAQEIAAKNAIRWSAQDGVSVATSGGLSDDWTNRKYKPEGLWAYQPLQKFDDERFATRLATRRNPIDTFLEQRLPQELTMAPRAERAQLIRRATFDLTGLPPTPEEIAEFVADTATDAQAFASVVERLLASNHYGERMAQHWLDVVRYADSSGLANDYERGNAWRYRDYVIRSFNQDKAYDQFVREQIAGDELDPANPEMLIATGFLRMGPWELTGMEVAKVARQRFLDDVTNSVGETFLAHSLQCARCHDHKFDPVPTRDYYSIQAVFATTQLAERPAPFLPSENLTGFEERRYLEQRQQEMLATLASLDEALLKNAQQWLKESGISPDQWNAAVEAAQVADRKSNRKNFEGVFNASRSVLMKQGVDETIFPPKLVGFTPQQFGMERIARKGLERLRWEFDRYEPFALAVYNGRTPQLRSVTAPLRIPTNPLQAGELEDSCILTGGDPFAAGKKVKPGVLSVISSFYETALPDAIEGRRRALADWIAHRDNPLTARVIANRVWLWHFNEPIAGNPNNFGSTGKMPTHPELLDWLATQFIARDWHFKELHRMIMSSEAYARSAEHPYPKQLQELDPLGSSYAVFKPRRLTGEELRDAMLAVSGELNRTVGGIPNYPEINLEAALQPRQVMGTFAAAWVPNPLPRDRHRRSIYSLKLRGLVDPLLEVFNAPAADFSCERRDASTVTPQVFSLFNSRSTHARALALAHRIQLEKHSDEQAVMRCFELTFGRKPTAEELTLSLAHWQNMQAFVDETPPFAKPPLEVRREAVEENTGEKFAFSEKLYANAEFVSDLQPAEVDQRTRALAELCLVMLNSSEFSYVY